MKTAALVLLGIAALCVPLISRSQDPGQTRWSLFSENSLLADTNALNLAPLLNQPPSATFTNSLPLSRKQLKAIRPLASGTSALPAPGVYETAPFTCIVVVRGGHPDDKMIVGSRATGTNVVSPKMRIITPELRFIPRGKR